MRQLFMLTIAATTVALAGSAQAAVKFYDSDLLNGAPQDQRRIANNLCPPIITTLGSLGGHKQVSDDGLGTVTLEEYISSSDNLTDIGPEVLGPVLGPGAFIFLDNQSTRTMDAAQTSNTSGIGAHGPSGTAPGQSAEWGVLSGFSTTGFNFCVSSPAALCNQNGFAHGQTVASLNPSTSYDLGTWSFDAEGDLEATTFYIVRTSNGGLLNTQELVRGSFVGASLPALPLLGFGTLALGLAAIGARSLLGRK